MRNQRTALIKTLAVSLVRDGRIKTTEVKAKVLKPFVEKLIAQKVGSSSANKIVKTIAPQYKDRNGGYTRIIKLKTRLSDGAKMAQIEFV